MGYDIYGDGEFVIRADKVPQALEKLRHYLLTELDTKIATATTIDKAFELADTNGRNWKCHLVDREGDSYPVGSLVVGPTDDCAMRSIDEDEAIFNAIVEFAEAGEFSFKGEDGLRWLWRWKGGPNDSIEEVDSEVHFGKDAEAPKVIETIVELVFPDGNLPTEEDDPGGVLERVREVLTQNGFGPFAGLGTLDAMAKAAGDEDNTAEEDD